MSEPLPTEAFDHALSTVDESAAVALVRGLLDDGVDPLTVLVDVIARGQRAVGDRWQRGEWTVAKEHAATAVAISATGAVTRFAELVPVTRGRVVVACAEREWHALPAMIISTTIRLHGWDTVLLGASTSPSRLSQCLHDVGPDATAVSCSVLGALSTTRRFIEASTTVGIPILVGGSAFGDDDRRARALGATAWAPHAQGAVDALRHLPTVVRRVESLPGLLMAEHSVIEVGHHRFVELLHERWPAATSSGPVTAVAREVLHQALYAVSAVLLTGDPRPLPQTAAWIDRLLTARAADPGLAAELGVVLAATLREFPVAHDLIIRHWAESLAELGERPT